MKAELNELYMEMCDIMETEMGIDEETFFWFFWLSVRGIICSCDNFGWDLMGLCMNLTIGTNEYCRDVYSSNIEFFEGEKPNRQERNTYFKKYIRIQKEFHISGKINEMGERWQELLKKGSRAAVFHMSEFLCIFADRFLPVLQKDLREFYDQIGCVEGFNVGAENEKLFKRVRKAFHQMRNCFEVVQEYKFLQES